MLVQNYVYTDMMCTRKCFFLKKKKIFKQDFHNLWEFEARNGVNICITLDFCVAIIVIQLLQ